LRTNGLIRIVLPLPPNVKLIDPVSNLPSAETTTDVWRSVPSVINVALTGPDGHVIIPRGPNAGGGYQLDARIATLQDQAHQALINHAQVQQTPMQRTLDDIAAFQLTLFSSPAVRALADAVSKGITPPDPDPPLNPNSMARRFSCGRVPSATAVLEARPHPRPSSPASTIS
jgi:hypothetical protein